MMRLLMITAALLSCGLATAQEDTLCKQLFDQYIVARGLMSPSDRDAAAALIASRGRYGGFWKTVLAELDKSSDISEQYCVRVLGMMLEDDACARVNIERERLTGETVQAAQQVCLSPDVVDRLLQRAQNAKAWLRPEYLLALVRARDVRTADHFRSLLGQEARANTDSFLAAVGLANLGDRSGVEWLIAHVDNKTGDVERVTATKLRHRTLGEECAAVLGQITGKAELSTPAAWHDWWKAAGPTFAPEPDRLVRLVPF